MSATSERDAILATERQRCDALIGADAVALDRVLAPNFVYVHSSGRAEALASYVPSVTTTENRYLAFHHDAVEVELLEPNVALVNGVITVERTRRPSTFLFGGVWIKVAGGWRLRYQQHTKLQPPAG